MLLFKKKFPVIATKVAAAWAFRKFMWRTDTKAYNTTEATKTPAAPTVLKIKTGLARHCQFSCQEATAGIRALQRYRACSNRTGAPERCKGLPQPVRDVAPRPQGR